MSDVNLDEKGNVNSLEDRLWATANLVSLEEHSFSSWLRTKDDAFLDDMEKYRNDRQKLMRDILGDNAQMHTAELWCMFKHCLGGAMRAYESGNRYVKTQPEYAKQLFGISEQLIQAGLRIVYLAHNSPLKDTEPTEPIAEKSPSDNIQQEKAETKNEAKSFESPSKQNRETAVQKFIKALKCCM